LSLGKWLEGDKPYGFFLPVVRNAYAHPKVKAIRDRLVQDSLWSDFPEVLDDWWACEITSEEEFAQLFVPPFYYGCEGDDRMVAASMDERLCRVVELKFFAGLTIDETAEALGHVAHRKQRAHVAALVAPWQPTAGAIARPAWSRPAGVVIRHHAGLRSKT